MTASEKLSKREKTDSTRNLIVVSGYYGYDNLGDEAILEEIVAELSNLSRRQDIVVLSANPEKTARLYGTQAANRWDLRKFVALMQSTKLFISGGGGLFQDVHNIKSILFYGGQIALAHLNGARIMVYAQGLGPLKNSFSRLLTKKAWQKADAITIRDAKSQNLLQSWGLKAEQTADPVWRLSPTPLPEDFQPAFAQATNQTNVRPFLVGLSLRPSPNFSDNMMLTLAQVLQENLPPQAQLLLLPLQESEDRPILDDFRNHCQKVGLYASFLDTTNLALPSQWLTLMEKFDLVVAMRLHALIMALKAGRPVIGMPYDPKVTNILDTFAQPALRLEESSDQKTNWAQTLKESLPKLPELAERAKSTSAQMEIKACKNFDILAKILEFHR